MHDPELQLIKQRTRDLYDRQTADYANKTRSYDRYPGMVGEIHRFLTLTLPELYVIDLGCGAGRDSRYLLEHGRSVVALDLSRRMVEATVSYCNRHPGLGSVQADIAHTPFRDASFGGAWVCASLLHLPSRQLLPALGEIRRILAPGAAVSISMKAGTDEGWFVGRTLRQDRWFTYVQPEGFASLMRQGGFAEVSVTPSGRHEWFVAEARRP